MIKDSVTEQFEARVIASHGRQLRVRTPSGERLARPARRDLLIVCGDNVRCEYDARHDEIRVLDALPRDTVLYRSNARGRGELIAANLSLLLIVIAPLPVPDFFLLDRYLATAHCASMRAGVLANKSELGLDAQFSSELTALQAAGIDCLTVSAQSGLGIDVLEALLRGQTAMLVGQSGAGKSSLLRALVPDSDAAVGALVRSTEDGRHTTTTARLYDLPGGGELIDAPGVRDFAPAVDRLEPRALGFIEIERLQAQCRFPDCRHMREPDCAVRAGIDVAISARRYESYRRLRRLFEQLSAARAPGHRARG